jgi:hypothetical protein
MLKIRDEKVCQIFGMNKSSGIETGLSYSIGFIMELAQK